MKMIRSERQRSGALAPIATISQRAAHVARNDRGHLLVEMVVALGISTIVLAAACQCFSQVYRLSVGGQNQVLASHIAQQLIDNARNQRFSTLQQEAGTTRTLVVNRVSGYDASSVINPRPLLLDMENLNYKNYSTNSNGVQGNIFNGTVQQTISDMGGGMLRVAVNVSWPTENGKGKRSLQMSTVVSQYGIHN